MTTQTPQQKYNLMFSPADLNPLAIQRVKDLIKQEHFFKCDDKQKENLLRQLTTDLSIIYNVQDINFLMVSDYIGSLCGCYQPMTRIMVLNKPSLVTFLHEYKHHLNNMTQQDNTEESARGFSHSLYFQATPKLFENAVLKGLLVFQREL
jgi:hypothetical protein